MAIHLDRKRFKASVYKYLSGVLFVLLGAASPAFGAALCNGGPAMLGGVTCDMLPIGGGSALCLFIGYDRNANGRVEGGSSDTCILIDAANEQHPNYSCAEACRNTDDCSKPQCISSKDIGPEVKKIRAEKASLK